MNKLSCVALSASLAVASAAQALVRPADGTELPNYDVRATTKGVMMGGAQGRFRAAHGVAPSADAEQIGRAHV